MKKEFEEVRHLLEAFHERYGFLYQHWRGDTAPSLTLTEVAGNRASVVLNDQHPVIGPLKLDDMANYIDAMRYCLELLSEE